MFTVQNAVRVALIQVAVVVFGVLLAALDHRLLMGELPVLTVFLMDYGVLLLTLPLVWITYALRVRLSKRVPETRKRAAFFTGVVLLLWLVALVGYATLKPWFAGITMMQSGPPGE